MIRQPPAAVPAAMVAAHKITTQLGDFEFGRLEEGEHGRQVRESAALSCGEKRERDDPHGLLGVIGPVAMGHPRGADELQFPEDLVHDVGRERTEQSKEQCHQDSAERRSR